MGKKYWWLVGFHWKHLATVNVGVSFRRLSTAFITLKYTCISKHHWSTHLLVTVYCSFCVLHIIILIQCNTCSKNVIRATPVIFYVHRKFCAFIWSCETSFSVALTRAIQENNVCVLIFLVTPCINDIKHFNVQLMHTTLKINFTVF
jgi:hypothetical protein